MKNILLTGGAGFIGSHVADRLLAGTEHNVVCVDDFNDFYDPLIKRANADELKKIDGFNLVEGDIRDIDFLRRVFSENEIGSVIHLAARAGVRPSIEFPLLYEDVNVRGTLNLLESCREFGVKRFLFASSSSVYGNNKKVPFSEADNVDSPVSPYAATKKAGELLCYNYHHLYGIDISCLRFFTVYGPRQRPEMAIHKFTELIYNRKPVPMFGNGSSKRDYTYISDIVDGVISAFKKLNGFNIYNLGESNTIDLRSMIELLGSCLKISPVIEEHPFKAGDVEITFADITKSERELGYNPKVPVEKGLELFVNWYIDKNARSFE